MTIDLSDNNPRISYSVAEGVTQTVFSVPFEFFNNADVTAYVDGVLKAEGADYTLAGGDGSTGTLTFTAGVTGASGGSTVTLVRHIALERTTDFVAGQDINRAALNEELDTIVGLIADLDDRVDRTIHLSDSEVAPSMLLTEDRKGRVLAFDASTGDVGAGPLSNDIQVIADNITEILDVNNQAAAAAASEAAAANSATAAQTAQTAAELAETNAETAETNAAASAVTAASEATTATTKASEASVSAAAAAASEAGVDADRVAAQAAAAAAAEAYTNAATSETNAATSETNAATSATSASNSASSAASSAANAGSSATAAAISASDADYSAISASNNSSEAAVFASNAATSASEAAVSAASIVGDVADAQSAATQAQDARDTASLHKLAAEAAATSATNTASALTGFDLDAIAETKGVTAVDVFVYDTSKDSDGGAWRKRTQGTSWYQETLNTATRGSRREFPAVAVIVAEAGKVTIYDGDDPALPMWMVANATNQSTSPYSITGLGGTSKSISAVVAKDGILCFGHNNTAWAGVLLKWSFLEDRVYHHSVSADWDGYFEGLSNRNSLNVVIGSAGLLTDETVNDVAMTVLPDAPIDPATGLPVPTILVGTDGNGTYSTSIITDSGDVYDIASDSTGNAVSVAFDGVSAVVTRSDGTVYVWDDAGAIVADGASPDTTYSASSTPALLGTVSEVAA